MKSAQKANFQNMRSMGSGIINGVMVTEDGRQTHSCLRSFLKGTYNHASSRLLSPYGGCSFLGSKWFPLSCSPIWTSSTPTALLVPSSRLQHYPGLLACQGQQAHCDTSSFT